MEYKGKIKIDPEIDMSKIRKQIAELTKPIKIETQIDISKANRQLSNLIDTIKDLNKSFAGGKTQATGFGEGLKAALSASSKSVTGSLDKIGDAVLAKSDIVGKLGKQVAGSLDGLSGAAQAFATGGISLAIGAVSNFLPLLVDWIGNMDGAKDRTEALKASVEKIGGAMQGFIDGIAAADGYLDNFPDTSAMNERQTKLQTEVENHQTIINDIYKAAAEERRALTEDEEVKVSGSQKRLMSLQSSMAAEELAIAQAKSDSIEAVAMADAARRDVSLEQYAANSQQWMATAQEQADKEKELAESKAMAEIAVLQAQHEAGIVNEESLTRQTQAKLAALDEEKAGIDRRMGDIAAAYADGYAQIAESNGVYLDQEEYKNARLAEIEQEHLDKIAEIERVYADDKNRMGMEKVMEDERYRRAKEEDYEAGYLAEQEAYLGHFLALAATTEEYGGELSESTGVLADNIIAAMDGMPEDARQAMVDTMKPMLEEMEKSEPLLYAKALTIGGGIIKKLKEALEVKSPSRATRRIFNAVMEGAKLGLADEEAALTAQSERIGEGVKSAFGKAEAEAARRGYRQLETYMDTLPASLPHSAAPGAMPGGGGTENHYDIHLTQNITSPKALSEAELTREAQDFISRMKWQLP